MNDLIAGVSKDLYINRVHFDNPFVQKSTNFYVRLIEIREGWVAYITCTMKVKYMKFDQFFEVFTRPAKIHGKVCIEFSTSTQGARNAVIKVEIENPWSFERTNENYKTTCYISNFKH